MLGIFALFEGRIIIVIAISNRHLVILGKYCCHIGKDIRMLDPKNPGARAPLRPKGSGQAGAAASRARKGQSNADEAGVTR